MKLTTDITDKINDPNHPIFVVLDRLEKIQDGMLKNDPEIKTHLREIWKQCQTYEELAHILSPEDIGIYMKGMQKYTGQYLAVEAAPKTRKRAGKTGIDDIT